MKDDMVFKPNKKITEQEAGRLVDILFSDLDVPHTDREQIAQWLADGKDRELKEQVMYDKLVEVYLPQKEPTLSPHAWPALAARLGLDPALMDRHIARLEESQDEPQSLPEQEPAKPTAEPATPVRIPLRRRMAFRVAAVLVPLLVIGGAIGLLVNRSTDQAGQPGDPVTIAQAGTDAQRVTVVTDTVQTVELPDGSTVKLKPGSQLTYAQDFAENRLVMLNGEAFFSVERDEAHPFRVESDGLTVTVLGTTFNVSAYDTGATAAVELLSGSVQVATAAQTVTLEPNQAVTLDRRTDEITLDEIGEADLLRIRGMSLSIDERTMDETFGMISQYFRVKVRVANDVDTREIVVVNFEDDVTLEEALSIIRLTHGGFDFTIDADTVTITRTTE